MKFFLILSMLLTSAAFAGEPKKTDMREGTKAVDEKYLKHLSGMEENKKSTESASNRTNQMEAKKSRQYQEEAPSKRSQ